MLPDGTPYRKHDECVGLGYLTSNNHQFWIEDIDEPGNVLAQFESHLFHYLYAERVFEVSGPNDIGEGEFVQILYLLGDDGAFTFSYPFKHLAVNGKSRCFRFQATLLAAMADNFIVEGGEMAKLPENPDLP